MNRPAASAAPSARLVSLDAYRGFVMLAMASGGLRLVAVKRLNSNWTAIANQFDHVDWVGCVFWDLIQPSFMFIVGVSMVMSYAIRSGQGQSWPRQCLHAVKRAVLLCLVGMFLDWYSSGGLYIQFIRVLQQIAIGYLIAFLVMPLGPKVTAVTAILLLVGHSAAYLSYGNMMDLKNPQGQPDPWYGITYDRKTKEWNGGPEQANFGQRLDMLMHTPMSTGRYVTFNAISSAATILFGVLVGELLRSGASFGRKLGVLTGAGFVGLAVGWLLSGGGGWIPFEFTPLVPLVKKIWTASFAIFAAGWTCLMLAAFYGVVEGLGFKAWTFPFVVVGMNSIAMYCFAGILTTNARRIAQLVVPPDGPTTGDPPVRLSDIIPVIDFSNWSVHLGLIPPGWYLTPLVESLITLSILWGLCYWLYRRQIFFKL